MNDAPHDILIDTHVHFHDCFNWPGMLNAAAANFAAAGKDLGLRDTAVKALVLCDNFGASNFQALSQQATQNHRLDRWALSLAPDGIAVVAHHQAGPELFILPGRQIQAHGGLELLALCSAYPHPDGLHIDELVRQVTDHGGLAVLPWGFGKWLGRRGRQLAHLLDSPLQPLLALGDNSGRLSAFGTPAPFTVASRKGIKILAGTDPLPFAEQQRRIGSYGTYLTGKFSESRVTACIKESLQDRHGTPRSYGTNERLAAFCRNQVRMQISKRTTNWGAS